MTNGPFRGWLLVLLLAGFAGGCSSTTQIETAPPHPARAAEHTPDGSGPRSGVRVVFEAGESPLPEGAAALRFRIESLHFRSREGGWISYPAEANSFVLRRGAPRAGRAVLATQLPPGAYDSVAVSLRDLYVEFGPNAGAPLTATGDDPVAFPAVLTTHPERRSVLRLIFEPGASLSRGPDCRWFFVPFVETRTE